MSPAKPCGSLPNWEGTPIQGVLSIPYATGLCVCSKSRYLNRGSGFVFLICMLTLRGGTFRSPLCFQHQFSHGSRESRRCSPFLHSFFSKMLQSCKVAMLQSPFRCRRGGEGESLNERTKDNFSNFIYHLKESRIYTIINI